VIFDAHDPARLAGFWAALLRRSAVDDPRGPLLPGSDTQVGLRFSPDGAAKPAPNPVHLHLTSTSPADQQEVVTAALRLGADHLDVGQLPEEGHVVLADPEGNEFCVIEPGNAFLAGCGLFGELACDGSRQVGLFWAEVLGWPLVWDENEETAVQSPHGGTKLAWGGPPLAPGTGRSRQRFELVSDGDLAAEVERLIEAGAIGAGTIETGVVALTDPDGNGFDLVDGTT
jgi:catechol 2,3-dioxygenase-like lactoylglutathione lyase family enzyme